MEIELNLYIQSNHSTTYPKITKHKLEEIYATFILLQHTSQLTRDKSDVSAYW